MKKLFKSILAFALAVSIAPTVSAESNEQEALLLNEATMVAEKFMTAFEWEDF